ncbi:MAG: hypothetical protein ACP5OL_07420, partial [Thermus sp.]
ASSSGGEPSRGGRGDRVLAQAPSLPDVLEWPYREEEVGPPLGRRLSLEALEGLFREALGSPRRFQASEDYVLALWDKE